MPFVPVLAASGAGAASPSFVNICSGLGVSLPVLAPVGAVTDPLLSGLLSPVMSNLNGVVGNVNVNLQQALSGKTLSVGVLDPSTNTLVTNSSQCNVTADSFQVDNNKGISLGGGQITGLGGTGNVAASAGDASAIALGNGASTASGVLNAAAFGLRATVTGSNGLALGSDAVAAVPGGVALGAGSLASRAAETFVDPFTGATVTTGSGAVSVGQAGQERQVVNVAAGRLATDAVNVGQLRGAINPLTASSRLAVSYTADGSLNPTAQINLAGNANLPAGTTQVAVSAVAPGALSATSTDAVNGTQLNATGSSTATTLGGGATYNTATGAITNPSYTIRGTTYTTVGDAVNALSASINGSGSQLYFQANSSLPNAQANGQNTVAIGPLAVASGTSGVALGNGAVSGGAGSVALGAGANDGGLAGVVSVGAPGAERRITNVAAGTIAAGATNAATTGQLYAGNQSLATILGGGAAYDTTAGAITSPTYTIQGTAYTTIGGALNALASLTPVVQKNSSYFSDDDKDDGIPEIRDTGYDAVAGGDQTIATGKMSTAIGTSAAAMYDGATAIGSGAVASADPTTAVGFNAAATANEASAFGAYAAASGTNSTALGRSATSSGNNSVAIGYGASATGNNSVAIGVGSTDGGVDNVVSVGSVGGERRIVNVAAGTVSATSTDAVNGSQLYGLGHAAVQYANDGAGNTLSSITLGSDQGGPVIIHNLAPGVDGADAATIGQVRTASANSVQYTTVNGVRTNTIALAGGNPGGVTITNLAAGVASTDAANVGQMQDYADQQVSNLMAYTQREIRSARADAAGGTALALAATGLRYDDRPGKVSVGGATAYYHGQIGVAFGVGATTEDGRTRLNASVTASPTMANPDVGAVVGASFSLN